MLNEVHTCAYSIDLTSGLTAVIQWLRALVCTAILYRSYNVKLEISSISLLR